MTTKIWECKIGEVHSVAGGADYLMRQAVADAYKAQTGVEPVFIFSGWGASLTEAERAAVENRLPAPATAPDLSAAYIGAREDLAIWKKRALEAEETARQLTRALAEEVNGPTFMGEPVLPATAPAQPEIVDLLAEMYELILANKVVLAEKSGGVWTWPDRAIEAVRKHRSGPAQPERKPMGQFEIEAAYQESQQHHLRPQDFNKVCDMVRAVEAFHGIKETP